MSQWVREADDPGAICVHRVHIGIAVPTARKGDLRPVRRPRGEEVPLEPREPALAGAIDVHDVNRAIDRVPVSTRPESNPRTVW